MKTFAVSFLLLAGVANADIQLQYVTGDGEKSRTVTMQLADGKLRTDLDDSGYTIWDRNSQSFTHVMHERKRYLTVDKATLNQLIQMASGMMAMLGQSNPELAEAQREAEKHRELNMTDRKDKVAGMECQVFSLLENGKPEAEMCMVRAKALKLSDDELQTFRSLAEFGQSLAQSLLGQRMGKQPEWLQGIASDWFPVRYSRFEADSKVTDMELVQLNQQAVPAESLAPPQDYQQMELPIRFGR